METVNFVEKFIIYIEDHLRERIDYDRVLEGMGVELKSFITIFTSLAGMTPYEYQTRRQDVGDRPRIARRPPPAHRYRKILWIPRYRFIQTCIFQCLRHFSI